eukprot:Opistho-2@90877
MATTTPYAFKDNYSKWENIFVKAIETVFADLHPELRVTSDAVSEVERLIYSVLATLCIKPAKSPSEIREIVFKSFPEALHKWVFNAGDDAIKTFRKAPKKLALVSASVFPVAALLEKLQKEVFPSTKIDVECVVYLCATLEYIVSDMLKLAGNYAKNNQKGETRKEHVLAAIENDPVLQTLFRSAQMELAPPLPPKNKVGAERTFKTMYTVQQRYMRDLEMIMRVFPDGFKVAPEVFKDSDVAKILNNIAEIYEFEKDFMFSLVDAKEAATSAADSGESFPLVGKYFQDAVLDEKMDLYLTYAENHLERKTAVEDVMKYKGAEAVMKSQGLVPSVYHVLPRLLLEPIHHVHHYMELLKTLQKCLAQRPDSKSADQLKSEASFLRQAETDMKLIYETTMTMLTKAHIDRTGANKMYRVDEELFSQIQNKITNWEGPALVKVVSELFRESDEMVVVTTTKETKKQKGRPMYSALI